MLATLIGVVVGVLDAVFLKTLDAAIGARNNVPFFYLGMPVFLYVCMLLSRKTFPKDRDYATDAVVNKINNYGPISFLSITKGFFLSILTYSCARIVEMMVANVLGLPIPFSSSSLISDASVYLAGG